MRAAGFLDVLLKPIPIAVLLAAVASALGVAATVSEAPSPAWDEHRALAAVRGQRADAGLLRRMVLVELPTQRDALVVAFAEGDAVTMLAILHRLRASCALVGATRLEAAVRGLQAQPDSPSALRVFELAVAGVPGLEDATEVGQQVP